MLEENAVDALLVVQPENRYYLSGFSGSAGAVVVTAERSYLLTDFRYLEQAREQSPHLEVVKIQDGLPDALAGLQGAAGFRRLGFEMEHTNYKLFAALQEKLAGVELRPLEGVVEKFRQIKDKAELDAMARAAALLDEGFCYICGYIKPSLTEKDVALELEIFLRRRGAEGAAFPFIVASGPRSSLPHGAATERVINRGDVITLDFGVNVGHYNSDMTRTVVLGRADAKVKEIYRVVLEAQLAGLARVRDGVTACEVDAAARGIIDSHGYGQYFGHGTGHGVGLAVHEAPRLAARDDTTLREGMVVTVEPGIYLPGFGGVRIEDSVVVEKDGCRLLTSSPKEQLLELEP